MVLKRLELGSFQTERQRAAKFVRDLMLALHSTVVMFHCTTLEEAVAGALEGEAAHRIYHARGELRRRVCSQVLKGRGHVMRISRISQKVKDTVALLDVGTAAWWDSGYPMVSILSKEAPRSV